MTDRILNSGFTPSIPGASVKWTWTGRKTDYLSDTNAMKTKTDTSHRRIVVMKTLNPSACPRTNLLIPPAISFYP